MTDDEYLNKTLDEIESHAIAMGATELALDMIIALKKDGLEPDSIRVHPKVRAAFPAHKTTLWTLPLETDPEMRSILIVTGVGPA